MLVLSLLLLSTLSPAVGAATLQRLQLTYMLHQAELIFEGQVVRTETRWSSDRRSIWTYITFEIVEIIKGEWLDTDMTLAFLGGTVGDTSLQVPGLRYPNADERGIYFVESARGRQVNPLLGWHQGHFIIRPDSSGVARVLTSGLRAVNEFDSASSNEPETSKRLLTEDHPLGLLVSSRAAHAMAASHFKQGLRSRLGEITPMLEQSRPSTLQQQPRSNKAQIQ